MGGSEPHSVGVVLVVHETERAYLVRLIEDGAGDDVDDEFWVPKSVVCEESDLLEKGDEGELFVREWWANAEGR